MDDHFLRVTPASFDDVILLAPILSSYGAWIRKTCPSASVTHEKMRAIESVQAKLLTLQEARPAVNEGVLFPLTKAEIETIIGALKYFVAGVSQLGAPSPRRDGIIRSCNQLHAFITAAFS